MQHIGLLLLSAIILGVIPTMAGAKTCRTYYDDERLAVMHENLANHEWARTYMNNLLEGDGEEKPWKWGGHRFSVRLWAQRDEEFFWDLMPTTKVTMMYPTDRYGISPKHGTAVREGRAFYHPWNYDPFNHPYRIQDPVDGEWYPSNDFAAGDMTSGEYPDDGTGMTYNGEKLYPVREAAISTYLHCIVPLLERMSQAYLLTEDEEYAHKAAILFSRVAYEFPNDTDKADRCQKKPWGVRSGLVTDHIWECGKLTSLALSYDALYDAIGKDTALVEFLKAKGLPVQTPADVRHYIEESIFRVGMQALKETVIAGNQGMHQQTAMALALVMDDHETTDGLNSKDIVEWCMYGDGGMAWIMPNGLFRDGGGFESPGYNTIKFEFVGAAGFFEQLRKHHPDIYPQDAYPDVWAHPKARAMCDYFIDLVVMDRFTPSIGDSGGSTLVPRQVAEHWQYSLAPGSYRFAYEKYGDPRYALAYTNGRAEALSGDPFEPYDGGKLFEAAQSPEAAIRKTTRVLDGYGVAYLHSGEGEDARELFINYSNHWGHRQDDMLNLALYSRYTDHLPDMGYPFTWEYRSTWDAGPYIHNTVVVDETAGRFPYPAGHLVTIAEEGPLHLATAAHDPYTFHAQHNPEAPEVKLFERTCLLVDVSETEYYVVDLFAVAGGTQHDQSWHGCICPIDDAELDWQAQAGGTLAGPDVPMFGEWTDSRGRKQTGPFSFLEHVRRASTDRPATFTWNMGLDYDAKVRLTVVPVEGTVELVRCDGRSPARPPDWSLDYLFVRRAGDEGLETRFVTVLDTAPGDTPTVRSIEVIGADPLTLRITHSGGSDDITLSIPTDSDGLFAHREIGVSLSRDGRTYRAGAVAGQEKSFASGEIVACDYPANSITVAGLGEADLVGRWVRLYSDSRSSAYRVLASERLEDGNTRLALDQTNILFDILISDFGEGMLHNSVHVFNWTEREDEGTLREFRLWNKDAVLVSEDGTKSHRVLALAHGERVHLQEQVSAEALRAEYTDANGDGRITATAYDYGIGMRVEAIITSTVNQ